MSLLINAALVLWMVSTTKIYTDPIRIIYYLKDMNILETVFCQRFPRDNITCEVYSRWLAVTIKMIWNILLHARENVGYKVLSIHAYCIMKYYGHNWVLDKKEIQIDPQKNLLKRNLKKIDQLIHKVKKWNNSKISQRSTKLVCHRSKQT